MKLEAETYIFEVYVQGQYEFSGTVSWKPSWHLDSSYQSTESWNQEPVSTI